MRLEDLLPQPPWLGPPLPRFLGIYWPWVGEESSPGLPLLPPAPSFIRSALEGGGGVPQTTYENIEEIEFPNGFDPDTFMPRKIVIHRQAKESR